MSSGSLDDSGAIRLQKILASIGLGSRRSCEELIVAGRVEVNGSVVRELGSRAHPERDVIRVDGMRIPTSPRQRYLALNKPAGVLSTMRDERGRPCLADLLGSQPERLYHVGRLDADSEGLLLLTNDGELAHRLTHPSYGVPKTYLVEVAGTVHPGTLRTLRHGVALEDGEVRVDAARVVDAGSGRTLVEVVLHEGRKHIVRRLLAAVGHPVQRLVRTRIGAVDLGSLRSGRTRRLTPQEVGALYAAAEETHSQGDTSTRHPGSKSAGVPGRKAIKRPMQPSRQTGRAKSRLGDKSSDSSARKRRADPGALPAPTRQRRGR